MSATIEFRPDGRMSGVAGRVRGVLEHQMFTNSCDLEIPDNILDKSGFFIVGQTRDSRENLFLHFS
jgi:hypothetical protein